MSDSFDPLDCSQPGSSVHETLQARTLEWVAISFYRVPSKPWDRTHISHVSFTGSRFLTISATWEAHSTRGKMFLHFSRKPISALATIFNMRKLVQNCELNYLMSRSAPKLIKFYITHYRLMHIQLGIEKCDDKISTAKISIIGSIREAHTSLKFLEPKWI